MIILRFGKTILITLIFLVFSYLFFPFKSQALDNKLFDVEYNPEEKIIEIKTSSDAKPEVMTMENPPRYVIDLPSTVYPSVSKKMNINDSLIKQIRVSQFKTKPNIVRISVEMMKQFDFEVRTINEGDIQNIKLTAILNDQQITIDNASLGSKYSKEIIEKNSLSDFEFRGNHLYLSGKEKITYEINRTPDQNTYELKIFDFTVNGLKNIPVKPEQYFENISIEEKNQDTVLIFKLKPEINFAVRLEEKNKLDIFASETKKDAGPNSISLDFDENDQISKIFISIPQAGLKYRTFILSNPDRLVIDTFGTTISDFSDPFTSRYSKIIQRVRYGYLDKNENQEEGIRIVFELKKRISIKENLQNDNLLELMLFDEYAVSSSKQKYLVVIDPGHGGNDPGALGSGGIKEKDVTLGVSYYVRQMLIESGIGVLLARSDDSEILLQPRVDVANNNKSDIFVSIHCNAMEGSSPMGVETYFRTPQSTGLAKTMHKNMIKTLNTPDRGIRIRNFFVIRKTTMPSVLIEIGYITNYKEGILLSTADYQKKVAVAIFNGIKEYLGEQSKI